MFYPVCHADSLLVEFSLNMSQVGFYKFVRNLAAEICFKKSKLSDIK
jgi:hypothetical protein